MQLGRLIDAFLANTVCFMLLVLRQPPWLEELFLVFGRTDQEANQETGHLASVLHPQLLNVGRSVRP